MRFAQVKIFVISFLCFFSATVLFGQAGYEKDVSQAYEIAKTAYGTNPSLVNGRSFEDIYRNDLGHPYLGNDQYEEGYLIFRNERFDTVRLKYNIYNQSLVVSPSTDENELVAIIPPNLFVAEFSIRGELFRRFTFSNGEAGYYHEKYIGSELDIVYAWSKKAYDSYHNTNFLASKFSAQQKKYYLVIHELPYVFSSNRNFAKKFEEKHQRAILGFLKAQKYNLRKPESVSFQELGEFCDQLLTGESGKITKPVL